MEEATIRRLPDGAILPACIQKSERHQILITFPEDASPNEPGQREFLGGALIEIQAKDAVYLGTVLWRRGQQVVMGVEHMVSRAALAEIENVWRSPRRE